MKTRLSYNPLAGIALAIIVGSAAAPAAADYGRAGGPVGADAIVTVAGAPTTGGLDNADLGKRYGIAGGLVGADAIARIARTPVTQPADLGYSQWYGRAGGPVGVAAEGSVAVQVVQMK